MGARAQAIGHASACISDVWSITSNVAGLSEIKTAVAAASYNAVPSFKSFNRMAAVFAFPVHEGGAAINAFRFGDDLYNEQMLSVGYASSFGLASLGAKINYLQYQAEGLDTYRTCTVSFGGIATITPEFLFGAYISNINQPVINELTGERLATILAAGALFKFSEKLRLALEAEKHIHHDPVIKSGIEYQAFKKIAFRTGFNFNPQSGFFGLGFTTGKMELSYALQLNHALGLNHQATVTIPFRQ